MNERELKKKWEELLNIKLEMQKFEEELIKQKKEWRLLGQLVRMKAQKVALCKKHIVEGIQ